ncbi:MAG: hypothetical protein D6724_08080 [Armatimonadetes bacterium]|nr:MAG: hypothetical protein D6724_08080 [Armatimonadota bacterium]
MALALAFGLFFVWVLYGALTWRRVAAWCGRFDGRSFGLRFALMGVALLGSLVALLGGFAWASARGDGVLGVREFLVFLPTGLLFVHLQMVAAGLMWRLGAETGGPTTASEEKDEA